MPNFAPKRRLCPTQTKIAWAAGIYEGEGCYISCSTDRIFVSQKRPWILKQLVIFFGGNIHQETYDKMYRWSINGDNARRFIRQVWPFLSPWRRGQIIQKRRKNK